MATPALPGQRSEGLTSTASDKIQLADWLSCAVLGGFLGRFAAGPARAEAARCACLVGVVCLERWSAEGEATGAYWTLEDLLELAAGLVSGVDSANRRIVTKASLTSSSCAERARHAVKAATLGAFNGDAGANLSSGEFGSRWSEDVPVYVPDSPSLHQRTITLATEGAALTTRISKAEEPQLHSPLLTSRDAAVSESRSPSAGSTATAEVLDEAQRSFSHTPLRKSPLDTPKSSSRAARAGAAGPGVRQLDPSSSPLLDGHRPVQRAAYMLPAGRAPLKQQRPLGAGAAGGAASQGGAKDAALRGRAAEPKPESAGDSRGRRPVRSADGSTATSRDAQSSCSAGGRASSSSAPGTPRHAGAAQDARCAAVAAAAAAGPLGAGARRVAGGAPPPRVATVAGRPVIVCTAATNAAPRRPLK